MIVKNNTNKKITLISKDILKPFEQKNLSNLSTQTLEQLDQMALNGIVKLFK